MALRSDPPLHADLLIPEKCRLHLAENEETKSAFADAREEAENARYEASVAKSTAKQNRRDI